MSGDHPKCGECQHFPNTGISWTYCPITKRDVSKGCKACKLNFKQRDK